MSTVEGLDLGSDSTGFPLVDLESEKIIASWVRIFVTGKSGYETPNQTLGAKGCTRRYRSSPMTQWYKHPVVSYAPWRCKLQRQDQSAARVGHEVQYRAPGAGRRAWPPVGCNDDQQVVFLSRQIACEIADDVLPGDPYLLDNLELAI